MASEPGPAGAAPPPATPAPARGGGSGLFNLARGAKGIALLLFFLPWITVSCAGTELASMSGYELATGSFSVRNPMTGEVQAPPADQRGDIWAMAAAGAIVAAIAVTFVLPRAIAALIAAAGALSAVGMIGYTVLVRLPGEMRASPMVRGASGADASVADAPMNAQQLAELIKVEPTTGFWAVLAVLIAAAVLNVMARSRAGPG